jgi:hypothetical protein
LSEKSQPAQDDSKVIHPEKTLTAPSKASFEVSENSWLVVARNSRINRSWEDMLSRYPENSQKCYEHLCLNPTQRQRGRIFPLKGKKYKGAWEYELTSGARVFYVPDLALKKVVVYFAGEHPKGKAPRP